MSGDPKPNQPDPPETDISDPERQTLLRETLQNLQEAFSEVGVEDDADTDTELHQNAAQAASDPTSMEPAP